MSNRERLTSLFAKTSREKAQEESKLKQGQKSELLASVAPGAFYGPSSAASAGLRSQDVKGKAKAINLVDEDDEVQIVDPEDDDFMEIRPIYKLNKDLDNWLEGFVTDGECMRLYSRVCWIGDKQCSEARIALMPDRVHVEACIGRDTLSFAVRVEDIDRFWSLYTAESSLAVSHPSLVAVEIFRLPHFDSDEDRRKVMQSVQIGSSDIQRRQIICMYLGVGETWFQQQRKFLGWINRSESWSVWKSPKKKWKQLNAPANSEKMDEMLRGRGGLIRGLKEVSKKKQRQATLTWEGAGAGAGAFRAPTPPPVVLRLDKDFAYPEGDPDAVTIRNADVQRLQPGEYLNDNIIDFCLKKLQIDIADQPNASRFHFFNCFFWKKLSGGYMSPEPLSEPDAKKAFERVRTWTQKVAIFDKDFLLVPINQSLHWTLAIICHPGKVMQGKQCTIVHLNSMGGPQANVEAVLRAYLICEWAHRKGVSFQDAKQLFGKPRSSDHRSLTLFPGPSDVFVPQQPNFSDCGVFLIEYAERFVLASPPEIVGWSTDWPYMFKESWFQPDEAGELKRQTIGVTIISISEVCKAVPSIGAKPAGSKQSSDSDDDILEMTETVAPTRKPPPPSQQRQLGFGGRSSGDGAGPGAGPSGTGRWDSWDSRGGDGGDRRSQGAGRSGGRDGGEVIVLDSPDRGGRSAGAAGKPPRGSAGSDRGGAAGAGPSSERERAAAPRGGSGSKGKQREERELQNGGGFVRMDYDAEDGGSGDEKLLASVASPPPQQPPQQQPRPRGTPGSDDGGSRGSRDAGKARPPASEAAREAALRRHGGAAAAASGVDDGAELDPDAEDADDEGPGSGGRTSRLKRLRRNSDEPSGTGRRRTPPLPPSAASAGPPQGGRRRARTEPPAEKAAGAAAADVVVVDDSSDEEEKEKKEPDSDADSPSESESTKVKNWRVKEGTGKTSSTLFASPASPAAAPAAAAPAAAAAAAASPSWGSGGASPADPNKVLGSRDADELLAQQRQPRRNFRMPDSKAGAPAAAAGGVFVSPGAPAAAVVLAEAVTAHTFTQRRGNSTKFKYSDDDDDEGGGEDGAAGAGPSQQQQVHESYSADSHSRSESPEPRGAAGAAAEGAGGGESGGRARGSDGGIGGMIARGVQAVGNMFSNVLGSSPPSKAGGQKQQQQQQQGGGGASGKKPGGSGGSGKRLRDSSSSGKPAKKRAGGGGAAAGAPDAGQKTISRFFSAVPPGGAASAAKTQAGDGAQDEVVDLLSDDDDAEEGDGGDE